MQPEPYKVTSVFDQDTLPGGLRRNHSTKGGVWGLVRVLEGSLRLEYADGSAERLLGPGEAGLILPEQKHRVEPLGPMRMRVEFYDSHPLPQ